MANGKLGSADLAAATNTTLYNPSGVTGTVNVSICNRNSIGSAIIRVAIADAATPTDGEWLEYDVAVSPTGIYERTGLVLGSGQYLVVYSTITGVSAVAYGLEA